jgi:hypothetical protein
VHKVVAALVGLVSIGVTACVMSGPKYRKISTKPKLKSGGVKAVTAAPASTPTNSSPPSQLISPSDALALR